MTNNQETINGVIIDILKGAKDVGGEIYGASKIAVVKAVDFAQEQAPLVVNEFVTWKFYEAAVNVVLYMIPILIMLTIICLAIRYLKKPSHHQNEAAAVAYGIGMVLSIMFSTGLFFAEIVPSIKTMVKAKVAPRVFVIEWVSDKIKSR